MDLQDLIDIAKGLLGSEASVFLEFDQGRMHVVVRTWFDGQTYASGRLISELELRIAEQPTDVLERQTELAAQEIYNIISK